ncbi:MAG TPA: glutathione S-transferase [Bacteriovoracaceae bacterium]|nr:glutathione S-transferase [Bacteriovoracaceae bacterium]
MITVHHLNNSRSQRILWLLEELGLPYEVKKYQRNKETLLAPEELKKVHPLGKSPVITDDSVTVAESGAIVEYLLGKYGNGRLRPKAGTPEDLRYTFWIHYAEGSAMLPPLLTLIFNKIETGPMPFFIKPIAKEISAQVKKVFINPQFKLHYDYIKDELKKSKWFAGEEFTAADIIMSYPVETASLRGEVDPRLKEFLASIHARSAYQRALERGGEYQVVL